MNPLERRQDAAGAQRSADPAFANAYPSDPPAFDAPWQAEAFALVVALHEQGLFTWSEWTDRLSSKLHDQGAADDGSDYFARWLSALEDLLADRRLADSAEVAAMAEAWQRAAHATPHGQPILLANDPLSSGR